jgi:hypothetical protein
MPRNDPNQMPYGALQYYQIHYIIEDADITNPEALLAKCVLQQEGEIRIDPIDDHIRIYSKWKHEDDLKFDPRVFEVVDKIAYHIQKLNGHQ